MGYFIYLVSMIIGVRDPTLRTEKWGHRDEDNSLYISGCKPESHEHVLWGWVRLKFHIRIWFLLKD